MSFFEECVLSANKFLKTVCFIDDQPVFNKSEDPANEEIDHRLYADVITKAFAPQGKFCAFYHYQRKEEEEQLLELAKSSDINVLDWRIILTEEARPVLVEDIIEEKEVIIEDRLDSDESEEDVEEKESRGRYALSIIEKILRHNFPSPKVILIFTAEYDAESIFNPIQAKLEALGILFTSNADELWFQNDRFKISIYFKDSIKNNYISQSVKNKIIAFENFPEIVNHEFASLITGLVLKTAIDSVSEVRANTFSLLESYNKKLDPAFLSHKALLPDPTDAEEHLLEVIGSDIKAILKGSSIIDNFRKTCLPQYLEEKYKNEEYVFDIPEREKFPSLQTTNTISNQVLKSIVINGIEKTFYGKDQSFEEQLIFAKNCHKELTKTFTIGEDLNFAHKSDIQFSILTTIKPKYQINKFILTQGTIVKEDSNDSYWLCIQPKCDSVRITTKKRAFTFLRIYKADVNSFQLVLNPEVPIYLKIDYKVYSSKSFDFAVDEGVVSSVIENDKIKFKRWDNKYMLWIAELKNDYAQSVSNNYSVGLSRVGLDLSEWLRRSS